MAQIVKYNTNNVTYTEGPFVVCDESGHAIRVEVEHKAANCPTLPDASIHYKVCKNLHVELGNFPNSPKNHELVTRIVDYLNSEVENGNIILQGNVWVVKKF